MTIRIRGDFSDFAVFHGYGSWYDSIKAGVAAVVPSHTIVGKWASGDTAGAVSAGVKWGAQQVTPQAKPAAMKTGGFNFGGTGTMPGWVMPVIAVAGVMLLLPMLKKRRR